MISRFANPGKFQRLADKVRPLFGLAAMVTLIGGLYLALYASPPDYQQGETVRIMYVHVPAAWVSLALYAAMALAAAIGLILRHALADIFCTAAAPVGAALTALCLVTGSLWGKPSWGAFWVWDARLTSVLILFLIYCGYIVLRRSFEDAEAGGRAGAILLIAGAVNLPIVHFSVDWWHTLHQPASIGVTGSAIDPAMLKPLLAMAAAYVFFAGYLILLRMKSELLARRIEAAEVMEEGL